ncbi:hypothetical protein QFZ94_001128 [Paraburkholderia sp. JPY465]
MGAILRSSLRGRAFAGSATRRYATLAPKMVGMLRKKRARQCVGYLTRWWLCHDTLDIAWVAMVCG